MKPHSHFLSQIIHVDSISQMINYCTIHAQAFYFKKKTNAKTIYSWFFIKNKCSCVQNYIYDDDDDNDGGDDDDRGLNG